MSANKIKVSVSISPDMHEWLKAEAAHETQESGEDVSVSRLVARAVKTMQGKALECRLPCSQHPWRIIASQPMRHTIQIHITP